MAFGDKKNIFLEREREEREGESRRVCFETQNQAIKKVPLLLFAASLAVLQLRSHDEWQP